MSRWNPEDLLARFARHCRVDGDCLIWTGSTNGPAALKYGKFHVSENGVKKRVRAHRWIYERLIGAVPKGLDLDHLCRNRRCVAVAHLEPVTRKENLQRAIGCVTTLHAAKTHCPQGHPYSGDNLLVEKRGRKCRACKNARQRKAA